MNDYKYYRMMQHTNTRSLIQYVATLKERKTEFKKTNETIPITKFIIYMEYLNVTFMLYC